MASLAPVCSICGKPVSLQDCKVDEHGNAVHGTCYAAKLTSATDGALRPWRQIARELASEHDRNRVLELSLELGEAMAAQGMDIDAEVSGQKKAADGQAPHGKPKDSP
jgi:hypothetical protein